MANAQIRPRARVYGDGGRVVVDDLELDRPERPCSHCGEHFQPTQRRRRLCAYCFKHATDPPTYSLRLTTRPR